MERLTIPDEKIEGGMRRTVVDARKVRENAVTIYWALKKYEDTGLTVEQIREIDRLYAEKCREVAKLRQRDTPIKVKPLEIYHPVGYRVGQCSKCENIVRDYMEFCFDCGCRLEWGSWEEWEETCKN